MDNDNHDLAKLLPALPMLVELGASRHVTATAEALGIPQSTVSRTLARAAEVVGTPLVLRKGRGVELTPAALALIPRAAEALEAIREGLAQAREESGQQFGRIQVAFQHTFGEVALPILIRAFAQNHPGVTFDLQQGSRAFCLDLLATGSADLALVAPPPAPSRTIGSEVLYSEPLKLVVSSGHQLFGSSGVRLDAVRDEPFIMLEPGYGMHSIVESLCQRAGFRPRVAFQGQDLHTVRGLVSAGLGIAVAPPEKFVAQAAPGGGLGWCEVEIIWPSAHRDVGLVWRNRADTSAQATRFRDMVLGEGRDLLGASQSSTGLGRDQRSAG
ncbi:DNA-binding transcriptional regulator, LysR family [Arthrobacter alpinus]|uniref:DNA-binding transcriptional regulator, LysR family n=1 Tax=Arthrobacter alpinus TaxID=656366 RepID=A0A1H5DMV2_9MICC|nr:LysR family transcriptional regulator [Arthrobacter alpinus]SED80146.1 DNA-binding transcriptional regulator, LysR family [Arthrobacter alpinus]